ncbi:MAG TPA: hypothetical protein VIA18_10120 [Polyangia bacterium]|nr:hypothetical protein [Polyangia bacterium]
MKLFGGKKGDEKAAAQGDDEAGYYDSPQETVSLSGPRNAPAANANANAAKPAAGGATAAAPAGAAQPAAARVVVEDEEPPRPSYGINQAIELMRLLPVDQNPELVVQVIKGTLESMKVKVSEIIADADRKTKDLEERVGNLKRAIADFEKEIDTRKEEIGRLEADHKETTGVRARLELAEKAQQRATGPAAVKAKTG